MDTSRVVSIRNARRVARAACIAMQRGQHKTSCHTWGDRQPTPGYSRTGARSEHRDEEKGRRRPRGGATLRGGGEESLAGVERGIEDRKGGETRGRRKERERERRSRWKKEWTKVESKIERRGGEES